MNREPVPDLKRLPNDEEVEILADLWNDVATATVIDLAEELELIDGPPKPAAGQEHVIGGLYAFKAGEEDFLELPRRHPDHGDYCLAIVDNHTAADGWAPVLLWWHSTRGRWIEPMRGQVYRIEFQAYILIKRGGAHA